MQIFHCAGGGGSVQENWGKMPPPPPVHGTSCRTNKQTDNRLAYLSEYIYILILQCIYFFGTFDIQYKIFANDKTLVVLFKGIVQRILTGVNTMLK